MMSSEGLRDNVQWIVGLDGSTGSEHALRWSISQAPAQAAAIRAVRAWRPHITGVGELDLPHLMDRAPQAVQAELDTLADEVGDGGASIEWTVALGNPTSTLLELAQDAELLVVGTRGLGGFKRLLLGSVSSQCASHAPIPIAVIPAHASLVGRVDRVVVGMDGSSNAKAALRWALDFSRPETTVQVVGVWEPSVLATPADRKDFDHLSASTRERFTDAVDEVCGSRSGDEANVETDFRYAKAEQTLLECGAQADLVVVGARGQGRVASAVLGSVTSRVLHHAPCPVVVVPHPEL